MRKARKPNKFEQGVLDVVLGELRRAMRLRGQLQITIDPFARVHGDGAVIFASPNTAGHTFTVESDGTRTG